MNKKNIIYVTLVLIAAGISCTNSNIKRETVLKKVDTAWLDSIKKNSDSSYSKKYRTVDFATADYYLSYKDSSVCQVMKDKANAIRQILIAQKSTRTYFAQYYANGQLIADLKFDNYGQPDGNATYFYEKGDTSRVGKYRHGLAFGEWKEFDEKSNAVSLVKYDSNGVRKN